MSLKYISQVFYSAGLPAIERYLNDKGPRKIATTEKISVSTLVLLSAHQCELSVHEMLFIRVVTSNLLHALVTLTSNNHMATGENKVQL